MQPQKNDNLRALYIDLLKKSVSHSIWLEDEAADSPTMKLLRKISPKIFGRGYGNLQDKQEGRV